MRGEADCRLAAGDHFFVALLRFRQIADVGGAGRAETLDAEFIEMGELDRKAPEIVPHADQDRLDLGIGFFRECGAEIVAADAMFLEQRAGLAHHPGNEIRRALAIGRLGRVQHRDGKPADRRDRTAP